MNREKLFTFILLFIGGAFLGLNSAHGQYDLDYGGMIGASNYLGEIGGTKRVGKGTPRKNFIADLRLDQTKFAVGGWIRYKVHPLVSVKAGLSWIRIGAEDATSDYIARRVRNLSFRNDIYEFNVQGEYNFYEIHNIAPRGRTVVDFGTYALLGGGMFYHNPKAEFNGKWWALQPLHTEGQGIDGVTTTDKNGNVIPLAEYKRFQAQVSGGLGFYYTFKRKWRIGWELGVRMTFTDYLDDISTRYVDPALLDDGTPTGAAAAALSDNTNLDLAAKNGITVSTTGGSVRGNPEQNDWYMFTAVTIGYVVKGKGNFYKQKYKLLTGKTKRKKRKTRAKF